MIQLDDLPLWAPTGTLTGRRLVNSKFPPIGLFDDVADAHEFEALYAVQALTNPRLKAEAGDVSLLRPEQMPFGITGCSYAVACFTHVNPDGSRFSDGSYGVMYIGDSTQTAIAEVRYHQHRYFTNVPELRFERFVFRELCCEFEVGPGVDATHIDLADPLYHPENYDAGRLLGHQIRARDQAITLRYHSVRNPGATCYALFSPERVTRVIQAAHHEMIWSDGIIAVNTISQSA